MKTANLKFKISSWEEDAYQEKDNGTKLTRAHVTNTFSGDIEGEGKVEYLMFHRADRSASFVGLQHVVGKIAGRSGSFVLEHGGTFKEGRAEETWKVVPGSGTGELEGLEGEGSYGSEHAEEYSMTFRYEIG